MTTLSPSDIIDIPRSATYFICVKSFRRKVITYLSKLNAKGMNLVLMVMITYDFTLFVVYIDSK